MRFVFFVKIIIWPTLYVCMFIHTYIRTIRKVHRFEFIIS